MIITYNAVYCVCDENFTVFVADSPRCLEWSSMAAVKMLKSNVQNIFHIPCWPVGVSTGQNTWYAGTSLCQYSQILKQILISLRAESPYHYRYENSSLQNTIPSFCKIQNYLKDMAYTEQPSKMSNYIKCQGSNFKDNFRDAKLVRSHFLVNYVHIWWARMQMIEILRCSTHI